MDLGCHTFKCGSHCQGGGFSFDADDSHVPLMKLRGVDNWLECNGDGLHQGLSAMIPPTISVLDFGLYPRKHRGYYNQLLHHLTIPRRATSS